MGFVFISKTSLREKRSPKGKDMPEKSSSADSVTATKGSVGSAVAVSKDAATKEEEKLLTLDGFLSYVLDKVKQDVRAVWRAMLACGYDLHFDR